MKGGIFCFFGIDGAGKTTVIKEVEKKLVKNGFECETIYMGRAGNHKLPFIKKIIKMRSNRLLKKRELSAKKIRGPLLDIHRKRSIFWVLGYYVEMWLRYIDAKKIAKKKIVLMDRYFYDGLILAKNGVNIFKYLTPKPTKSFLLYAPPKLILKRKQEAKKENIIDFYNESKKFSKFFDIKIIDNSQKLNNVVEEIYETIKKSIRT